MVENRRTLIIRFGKFFHAGAEFSPPLLGKTLNIIDENGWMNCNLI
jgi:hypothetical protein